MANHASGLGRTRARHEHRVIHLINPLWDAHGGGDWDAIEMYRALHGLCRVRLWSSVTPAAEFRGYPIEVIRPWLGRMPIRGTFVFIGAYFRIGHWFKLARPRRTILLYNTHQPDRLKKVIARLAAWHRARVEIVYASRLLRRLTGQPGPVLESGIDLSQFFPLRQPIATTRERPFTIGRLSRDVSRKHHPRDPLVYAALAAAGVDVRIMGGTCLRQRVVPPLAESLLPAGAVPAAEFLRSLDCFYYRTGERILEAFGRVVFEAMACGLPVVCSRRGGYADYITHGVNGFLFDTDDEAIALIMRLRDDPALRDRIGHAARRTVEALYASEPRRRKLGFFAPPSEVPPVAQEHDRMRRVLR